MTGGGPEPAVSGVITTYARPAFLREAVTSALDQTRPLFELIVVDDASPEDPSPLLAAFGDRVRVVRMARNGGANAARNAGVAAARGDVVAFLDDDDVWHPTKLDRQVPQLGGAHEASLCGWHYQNETLARVRAVTVVTEAQLRSGNPFCGTSGLVAQRRALLDEPFDETLPKGQDWDEFVRLAKRRPLAYVPEPLYARRHGAYDGITRSGFAADVDELLERTAFARKHRDWLGEHNYRAFVARELLINISRRPRMHRYIRASFNEAGAKATLAVLFENWLRALRRRRPRPVDA